MVVGGWDKPSPFTLAALFVCLSRPPPPFPGVFRVGVGGGWV